MPRALALLLVLAACRADPAAPEEPEPVAELSPLHAAAVAEMERQLPAAHALRRALHQHPELAGAEQATAAAVVAALQPLGVEVQTEVGGHGVLVRIVGGRPGRVVAFRADFDAARSTAPDPDPYPSQVAGVRHICGHDVHTAVALAIAHGLSAIRTELPGTVVLLFQPAEETASGARAMLAAGAFAEPRPEAIFAFHTAPLPVGTIGSKSGELLPSRGSPQDIAAGAPGTAPGATNHPELELRSRAVVRAVVGADHLAISQSPVSGFSEDFGHYQALTPGVMMWLGVVGATPGAVGLPHHPAYLADEGAIGVGARVALALLLAELERP